MNSQGWIWRMLVSHHGGEGSHRCYRLPIPGRKRWICARCLGLYPVLLLVVIFESTVMIFESEWRWMMAFSLVTPAVVDWSRSMLFKARGANWIRTVTGLLAGVGLGVAFSDYFRDSSCSYFWTLIGVLTLVIALVWWCRPVPSEVEG